MDKINPKFRVRLKWLGAKDTVQAIVFLGASPVKARQGALSYQDAWKKELQHMKASAQEGMPDVDAVLACFGGKCLSGAPNAMGFVIVETTPAGITVLAASSHVWAILENPEILLNPLSEDRGQGG